MELKKGTTVEIAEDTFQTGLLMNWNGKRGKIGGIPGVSGKTFPVEVPGMHGVVYVPEEKLSILG